jgi:hypothetical protein
MRSNISNDTEADSFATGFVAALISLAILAGVAKLGRWLLDLGSVDAVGAWLTAPRFSVAGTVLTGVMLVLLVATIQVMLTH